jgi:hypothetical protein
MDIADQLIEGLSTTERRQSRRPHRDRLLDIPAGDAAAVAGISDLRQVNCRDSGQAPCQWRD